MITLTKAIEVLDLNVKEAGSKMPHDVKDSLIIAVRCMITVKTIRLGIPTPIVSLYPGEAPDINDS